MIAEAAESAATFAARSRTLTPCGHCGYNLDGLNPVAGATVCPECAHQFTGMPPAAHWLYRCRWLVGVAWCIIGAIAWEIVIPREFPGSDRLGHVGPAVATGLLASLTTIIGGRILTPQSIRQAIGLGSRCLLSDTIVIALCTSAGAYVACYATLFIMMLAFVASGGTC